MSLQQFQAGMAELIRLPDRNRRYELPPFLSRFDLRPEEKERLEHLSRDPKLAKYGRSMAGVRLETIQEQLRLSKRLIPKDVLEYVWEKIFEPKGVKIRFHRLTSEFLNCLIEDPEAKRILSRGAPPFILDVLKFERVQLAFYRGEITIDKDTAPQGSLLRHKAFRILNLEHDIPSFILLLSEKSVEESYHLAPEPRDFKMLFLPDETEPGCRYFEIDTPMYDFLEALGNDPLVQGNLPSSIADLVELGLCKPLSSSQAQR